MTREHIEHLAAALGALAFALFISYFNTGAHAVNVATLTVPSPALVTVSSSTPASSGTFSPAELLATTTFPDLIIPASTFEKNTPAPATPPAAPTAPAATPTEPTTPLAPAVPPVVVATTTATPPATPASPATNSSVLATLAPSVVNILCLSSDQSLHSISGSGVIIDSRGIILTVAHVAQMVLLEEYLGAGKVSCTARIGNPARAAYLIRPIYVSSTWLHANSTTLISSEPTGTGEDDVALLGITGSATGAALPSSFPAVALSSTPANTGDTVGIGSYGAQDLSTEQVVNDLVPTLAMSTVNEVYTFDTDTVDVLSIGGTIASQEGSSGGGIVNTNGSLVGLITTSDVTGSEATRDLRAITTSYLNRTLRADTGSDIESYIGNKNVTELVNSYAPTAQTLGQFLANALGLQP